jgi:RNA polymerase sigma-70 factor (ECF subfamily)
LALQTAILLEDAILVDRLQSGDIDAFAELIEKYQDRVFNTLYRIVGSREDARDLTQETFLKALSAIGTFRRSSQFYTWLFRIAVNLALTFRRRRQREQALHAAGAGNPGTDAPLDDIVHRITPRGEDNPAVRAVRNEQQEQVAQALNELEPDQRTIIVLRDIEGLDYLHIAEVLKIAPGTVKSRLHRARSALRGRLAPLIGRSVEP